MEKLVRKVRLASQFSCFINQLEMIRLTEIHLHSSVQITV